MKKINALFNKKNLLILITTIITCLIIHMPLYTKNILTADILLNNYYYSSYSWEISLGRFGLYIVGILKSFLIIPHIELIISIIILSLVNILIIDIFKIKNKIFQIITCILISVCPTISSIFLFNYCSVAYMISLFFSIFSLYYLIKGNNKYLKYIIPIISIIISMSMYQAFISTSLTLLLLYNIYNILNNNFNLKDFFKNIFIIGLGIIIYYLLMKLSLIVFNVNLSNYSGANSFSIENIINIPNMIIKTYTTFYELLFTNKILNNTILYNHLINISIIIITIISIIIDIIKNKLSLKNILLLIISIVAIPIFTNFILLIIPNTKMQLLMASSYILLIPFIISELQNKEIIKYILIALLILLIRNYTIETSATYSSLETTYNKTYKIASNIVDKINDIDYNKKIMITGNLDKNKYYNNTNDLELNNIYKLNYGFIANKSLFWDEYTNIKNGWTRFMYEYLGVKIDFIDINNYNKILQSKEYKEMQEYPNKESIKLIDDIIVIKF